MTGGNDLERCLRLMVKTKRVSVNSEPNLEELDFQAKSPKPAGCHKDGAGLERADGIRT